MQSRRRRLVALRNLAIFFVALRGGNIAEVTAPSASRHSPDVCRIPESLEKEQRVHAVCKLFQCGGFRQHGLVICREECVFVLGQPRPCAANLVLFYWEKSSRRAAQRPDPAKPCWCCLKRPWATPSLR